MASVYCIRIPRMSASVSESFIVNYFNEFLGHVSRVFFGPAIGMANIETRDEGDYKSAVVCFDSVHSHKAVFFEMLANGKSITLDLLEEYGEHWAVFKYDVAVAAGSADTVKVSLIDERCTFLEKKVANLEEKLEGARNVIYQLLGGLFHQERQSGILDLHMDVLYPERRRQDADTDADAAGDIPDVDDDDEANVFPTTRQGDALERRIFELEKRLASMLQDKENKL
jgi:chaperonin cofactor prefoldin